MRPAKKLKQSTSSPPFPKQSPQFFFPDENRQKMPFKGENSHHFSSKGIPVMHSGMSVDCKVVYIICLVLKIGLYA